MAIKLNKYKIISAPDIQLKNSFSAGYYSRIRFPRREYDQNRISYEGFPILYYTIISYAIL